jgi:hypothetical protein
MEPTKKNQEFVTCRKCRKVIAELAESGMNPSAEECYKAGNIPIPNFGWFCSQECALEFEKQHDVKFARTSEGRINYYL